MGKPSRRKVFLSAMLLAGLVVTTASTVLAQEAAGQVALPEGAAPEINEGSLYAGPYEITGEDDLIYGGNVSYKCEDLPTFATVARS